MKISLECCCGASVVFEDAHGNFINPGGELDKNGRKFLVECRSDEWQDRHQSCLLKNRN